jgi:nucleoside-diphosphate-sugar epimerase
MSKSSPEMSSTARVSGGATGLHAPLSFRGAHDGRRAVGPTILDGTRIVIEESAQSAIERAVVTSSTVTVGYSSDPSIVLDEGSFKQSWATTYHAAK